MADVTCVPSAPLKPIHTFESPHLRDLNKRKRKGKGNKKDENTHEMKYLKNNQKSIARDKRHIRMKRHSLQKRLNTRRRNTFRFANLPAPPCTISPPGPVACRIVTQMALSDLQTCDWVVRFQRQSKNGRWIQVSGRLQRDGDFFYLWRCGSEMSGFLC